MFVRISAATLAVLLLGVGSAHAQLQIGLVSYWPFDGNLMDMAPSTANGHGIMGTDYTADTTEVYVPGMLGNAIDLDQGQYVLVNNDESLYDFDTVNGFSISAWFLADELNKSWQALIAKGEGQRWRVHRRGGETTLTWNGGNNDVPVSTGGAVNPPINDMQWHHFVGVSDSLAGEVRQYMDGNLVSVGPAPNLENNAMQVRIGDNPDTADRSWHGKIDEVGIWDRILTDAEVAQLWNGGAAFSPLGPALPEGDVNGDFMVDMTDYGIIQTNFFLDVTSREEGDLDFDGKVGFGDFRKWKDAPKGNFPPGAAAVPEPSCLSLLFAAMGVSGLLRRRR